MKAFHEVRKYEGDFAVWCGEYGNIGYLPHWHKEIELMYVRSGSARMRVGGFTFTAHKGDLVVCDSAKVHGSPSFNMDNFLDFLVFDTKIISSGYESARLKHPLVTSDMLTQYGLTDELQRLFSVVKDELSCRRPYYKETTSSAVRYFWYLLRRSLPKAEEVDKSKHGRLVYDMQRMLEYIDTHYTDGLPQGEAAKQMGLSTCHFSRVFKRMVGMPYVTYVNLLRIEQAAELLINGTDSVLNIAMSCGFNNIRTFNRVFRSVTGCTPLELCKLPEPDIYNLMFFHTSAEQRQVENDSSTIWYTDSTK